MDTHSAALARTTNEFDAGNESAISAISWPAILGGGVAATALSLILLALGSGLGLSSISPWQNAGASAKALGIGTAIWLVAMQLISSGFGGYLAGRLRTRWVGVHTDEVFFRDTAHGFLVWAVSVVVTAAWLASAAASLAGSTAAGAMGAGVVAAEANPDGQRAYLAQRPPRMDATSPSTSDDSVAQAKTSADAARKAAAYASLWIFVSLLVGAFSASYAATWGGRSRDRVAHS